MEGDDFFECLRRGALKLREEQHPRIADKNIDLQTLLHDIIVNLLRRRRACQIGIQRLGRYAILCLKRLCHSHILVGTIAHNDYTIALGGKAAGILQSHARGGSRNEGIGLIFALRRHLAI